MLENQKKHYNLLTNAYDEYLQVYFNNSLEPKDSYLTYDFEFLNKKNIGIFGNEMINSDLREITNILNRWKHLLIRWNCWNLRSFNSQTTTYQRTLDSL